MSTNDNEELPSSIAFHYVKSNFFRVVHADGAMGGFTPRGELFFSLYSERAPLPDVTVQTVENSGQLGQEIIEQRRGSEGILRELEVGVVMDFQVAQAIVVWLQERIKIAEQMRSDSRARESGVRR